MDETSLLLGKIKANQEAQGERIEKIEAALKETNANIGRIVKICDSRTPVFEQMESHMQSDRPIEEFFGEHALKIICGVVSAVGMLLLGKFLG